MKDDLFGKLTWNDDIWEGAATFVRFRQWGAALDEKDPKDTRPAEQPDRSPTKRQLEAGDELMKKASEIGGEEGEAMAALLSGFVQRMAAGQAALVADEAADDEA